MEPEPEPVAGAGIAGTGARAGSRNQSRSRSRLDRLHNTAGTGPDWTVLRSRSVLYRLRFFMPAPAKIK